MTMTELNSRAGNMEAEMNNTAAVQRLRRPGAELNTKAGNMEAELNNTAAVQRLRGPGAELNTRTTPTPSTAVLDQLHNQLDSPILKLGLSRGMLTFQLIMIMNL